MKIDRITVSLEVKKIETYISRNMERRINSLSSNEITEMSNKGSVIKVDRAVAISK